MSWNSASRAVRAATHNDHRSNDHDNNEENPSGNRRPPASPAPAGFFEERFCIVGRRWRLEFDFMGWRLEGHRRLAHRSDAIMSMTSSRR
jgi:hypothetical protein